MKGVISFGQWFSTFLMPLSFKIVPHIVVAPDHNIMVVVTS